MPTSAPQLFAHKYPQFHSFLLTLKWNDCVNNLFFVAGVHLYIHLEILKLPVYEWHVSGSVCFSSGIHTEAVVHVQLSFKWNVGCHWKQVAAARWQGDCRLGDHCIPYSAGYRAGLCHAEFFSLGIIFICSYLILPEDCKGSLNMQNSFLLQRLCRVTVILYVSA